MNHQQLSSFIALYETCSFSKASRLLYCSQSTVSHHLKKLEQELGIKLFNRTTSSVAPTQAGNAFYEKAIVLKGAWDDALLCVESFKKVPLNITLGLHRFMVFYDSATSDAFIESVIGNYPNTEFSMSIVDHYDQGLARLDEGSIDFFIADIGAPELSENRYKTLPIKGTQYYLCVGANSDFSSTREVTFKEISDRQVFLYNDGIRPFFDAVRNGIKKERGDTHNICFEDTFQFALRKVARCEGITVSPIRIRKSGIVSIPLELKSSRPVGLIWLAEKGDSYNLMADTLAKRLYESSQAIG